MSSDVVYFPDALPSAAEAIGASCEPGKIGRPASSEVSEEGARHVAQLTKQTDEWLLEQVGEGAKEALAILFSRHARAVRNVAYRILRDEAEAEDLVQDVFLFICRKAGLYDASQGRAAAWIIHVAYHRSFDRRRRLNARHFYSTLNIEDSNLQLSDSRDLDGRDGRLIEELFGKQLTARFDVLLTPEQREVIRLHFVNIPQQSWGLYVVSRSKRLERGR
jgi:RNA polymerase sigma-70 factor (ECF subfamily)